MSNCLKNKYAIENYYTFKIKKNDKDWINRLI